MKVAIVGTGNMGTAYAKAMLQADLLSASDLILYKNNPEKAATLAKENIGQVLLTVGEELSTVDVVILGVKPQMFKEVAEKIQPFLKEGQLIVSIMAGVKMENIAKALGQDAIVRAMPNTPCQIGLGVTGYFASSQVTTEQLAKVDLILKSNGKAVEVAKEDLIDAVTAVSGSGPAYFFYIIKSMVEAGKNLGLSDEEASLLAKETMNGAYHLMNHSDKSYDELITAVRSKGGTTDAALKSFDANNLEGNIKEALQSANDRAAYLSSLTE
ncbi:MAG: pyrroline-5-carboxylate reductase [Cytophagales bacterium]|nr:pyrroline-5-carboxylate reductase [Cytophagales bacterium]